MLIHTTAAADNRRDGWPGGSLSSPPVLGAAIPSGHGFLSLRIPFAPTNAQEVPISEMAVVGRRLPSCARVSPGLGTGTGFLEDEMGRSPRPRSESRGAALPRQRSAGQPVGSVSALSR